MKTKHSVDFDNAENSMPSKRPVENNLLPPSKKQKTIFSYTEKKSQQQMYAELAAVDRRSFLQIERLFSAGALFLTKLRSSMSDSTLDKLIFFKLFFALKNEHIF